MSDFASAAWPWIAIGLAVAVVLSKSKDDQKKNEVK